MIIALEHARPRLVPKPWGSETLSPWNETHSGGEPIGEIWFERSGPSAHAAALRLKLLFTQQPLSIQVHPDDRHARSLGLPHGKSEAWYVLSAEPGAQIALGLKRVLTLPELRRAITAGSIEDLVQWRSVVADDVIFVPAGTIHAIGPGLVLAEIQQASEATFRLFDFGRGRPLDVDNALAVAEAKPAHEQPIQRRLSSQRLLLVIAPSFILERIDLPAGTPWELRTNGREAWLFVLDGHAQAEAIAVGLGDALFIDADRTRVTAGPNGLRALVAYAGSEPSQDLLEALTPAATDIRHFDPFPHLALPETAT